MRRRVALALFCLGSLAEGQNIFTVAGIPYSHRNKVDSQPALRAPLGSVYGLAVDKATDRIFLTDEFLVLRLEADGTLLALAGVGPSSPVPSQLSGGYLGGPLASALHIQTGRGMAFDAKGVLYLSDAEAGRVYRFSPDGTVTTFAGGGTLPAGSRSDGGPATAALLQSPRGLVFDSKGNLDIAEVFCNCIFQVTPDGIIRTLYTLPPSPSPHRLTNIEGLAIDAGDNLYLTEWFGNLVVKVAADGSSATTIAGMGTAGFGGDGGPAAAALLSGPSGVTLDGGGNIYIADTMNHRVRRIAPDGTIATIAGTGKCGFSGDGGPAAAAQLCNPAETAFDGSGGLLIADYGNRRVRRVAPDGTIATIVGSGGDPGLAFAGSSGDGGPPIHATFYTVGGIAFDQSGNLYVSETQGHVIRKITPDGKVSTFAGTGRQGYSGDGGPASRADLMYPGPLSVGPDGALYVISGDSRVRKITLDGYIALVAGTGTGTGIIRSQGDGGPAVNATLNEPGEVAFDRQGNIYIADTSNARVRKIDTHGIITTVAGPAQQGVDYFNAVAVDPAGNLYVAWTHATPQATYATVNRVNPDGSLTAVAGSGQPCTGGPGQFTLDGVAATQARLCAVVGMAVDPGGLLNLSEGVYSEVVRLGANGNLQVLAGNSSATSVGDGGPALQASLIGGQGWSPGTVAFDPAGNLYIAEPGFNLVRQVSTSAYKITASPDHIGVSGAKVQRQTVTLPANFAEPFPYAVSVNTTDGGSWLTTNRVTGFTDEAIAVSVNPGGLAPGTYHGMVTVTVSLSAASQAVYVPVTLTLP